MIDNYKSLDFLENTYKNIIDLYFKDKPGKYIINNNILEVDFDNWGKEYFYIENKNSENNENKKKYYDIKYNDIISVNSIAILLQIGNWDVFKKMESYIDNFKNISINIYFFMIKEFDTVDNINYLKYKYKNCVIASCENKGMDIGPFLLNLHYIKTQKYNHDFIFKIHTKSSDNFRNESLNILMNSYDIILSNIQKLSDKNNGIFAGNIIYKYNEFKEAFLSNYYYIKKLVKYFYDEDVITDKLEFCAGTMFIFKNKIFDNLNNTKIEYIYNLLNNNETLDYHWYSIFYSIDINNKKKIFDDYKNNK